MTLAILVNISRIAFLVILAEFLKNFNFWWFWWKIWGKKIILIFFADFWPPIFEFWPLLVKKKTAKNLPWEPYWTKQKRVQENFCRTFRNFFLIAWRHILSKIFSGSIPGRNYAFRIIYPHFSAFDPFFSCIFAHFFRFLFPKSFDLQWKDGRVKVLHLQNSRFIRDGNEICSKIFSFGGIPNIPCWLSGAPFGPPPAPWAPS